MTLIGTASALWLGNTTQVTNNGVDPNLLGEWKFDGNLKDSTTHGDNLTITQGITSYTSDRFGNSNKAFNFNGSTGVGDGPNNHIGDDYEIGTGSMSWSIWFKTNTSGTNIFYRKSSNSNQNGFLFTTLPTGQIRASLDGNSRPNITADSPGTYIDGKWHLSTAVFNRSDNMLKLYMDGKLVATSNASSTVGINLSPTNYMVVGSSYNVQYFTGALDDLRIYNKALSTGDVSRLYSPPKAQLDSSQQGLIGWWKLNGNTKDSTPYSNNGTWLGTSSYAADRKGMASGAALLSRTGSGSNIAVTVPALKTDSLSETLWFQTNNATNDMKLTSAYDGTREDDPLGIYNGYLRACLNGTSGCIAATTNPVSDGKWHFVVLVGDTSSVRVYLDGNSTPLITINGNDTYVQGTQFRIGGSIIVPTSYNFSGSISDVRIYNRALSANEIKTQYQSYNSQITLQSPKPTNTINLNYGLVGYWPFNNNTRDMTVYQDNGVNNGGTTLTTDRKGRANSAYNFAANSSGILAANTPAIDLLNSMSVSVWIRFTGSYNACAGTPSHGCNIIEKRTQSSQSPYDLSVYGGGGHIYSAWHMSGSWVSIDSGIPALINQWTNIVFTRDSSRALLYVNGVQVGSNNNITGIADGTDQAFNIGGSDSVTSSFLGDIDDVRIYNRALSTAEVQALYNTYD